jgi:LysR family transcriptional regulator, nitrogen assimilation regulatory protein
MEPGMAGIRDMQLFVAAYETQSFTAAASRERATQSGVSQHVRKLEESLGVKLFSRQGGRVAPTPAGSRYYESCVDVLRAHAAAGRSVADYGKGVEGSIVIGLMPTMTRCLLAPVLARFIAQHPNANARVVEGYSATLTEQVQAGELDFAVVPEFLGAAGLKTRLFSQTQEVLISRARSRLRHGKPVRLADLAPLKIVVPSSQNTRRPRIETYLASNGIRIARLLELDSMLGTLDFIARTDWVTILPALVVADADASRLFTVNPIVDPPFRVNLVLIEPARQPLSPAARAFVEILEEEAARLDRSRKPVGGRREELGPGA